ncbi:hypothetical protein GBA52_004149 [Prunus armeniaca]|nr:hypothetical protein GBA52_004149 [Prunus armeniaca]
MLDSLPSHSHKENKSRDELSLIKPSCRNVPRRIRSIVHKEVLHRTGRTSFAQLRNVELSTGNSETRRDSIQVLALVISCETLCKCLNLGYFEAIKSKRILKVAQNKFD